MYSTEQFNKDKQALKENFQTLYTAFKSIASFAIEESNDKRDYDAMAKFFEEKKSVQKTLNDERFYVAFVGPYSTGKSTLLNAIFKRDFLPMDANRSSTAFKTYIHTVETVKEEKAKVTYCNKAQTKERKKFYLKLAKEELRMAENLSDLMEMETSALLEHMQEKKEELLAEEEKINDNILDAFERLLKAIQKEEEGELEKPEEMTIDESIAYVETPEGDEESNLYYSIVLIEKMEIFLKSDVIPSREIVFVDLPGVDADNPRHKKVTEDFTLNEGKAHAFLIITMASKVQNDTLNDLLRDLSKKHRQIDRAFWVLNRSDETDSPSDSKRALMTKAGKNNIEIDAKRVFTTSAKLYKDTKKLSALSDNERELAEAVDELRNALTNYLSSTIFQEFIESKQQDYENLKKRLLGFLEPRCAHLDGVDAKELKEITLNEGIITERDKWFAAQRKRLKETLEEVKSELETHQLFSEEAVERLKQEVIQDIDGFTEHDIKLAQTPEKDVHSLNNNEIARFLVQGTALNEKIRKVFLSTLEEGGYLERLLTKTQDAFIGSSFSSDMERLPLFKQFKEILASKNLRYRLEGLCDAFLISYDQIYTRVYCYTTDDEKKYNTQRAKAISLILEQESSLDARFEFKVVENGMQQVYNHTFRSLLAHAYYRGKDIQSILNDALRYVGGKEHEVTAKIWLVYIREVVKHHLTTYAINNAEHANELVSAALNNHFKKIREDLLELLDKPETSSQMLKVFRDKLKGDKDFLSRRQQRESAYLEALREVKK